jgi:hypothetical protein
MRYTSTEERELYTAITNYLEKMDRMYAPQCLDEEKALEMQLRGVRRAASITDLVINLAKLGDLEERYPEEAGKNLSHIIEISMCRDFMEHSIKEQRTPQE